MKRIGPGPAKYILPPLVGYPNHCITKERLPAWTIPGRRNAGYCTDGPGAAKYMLEFKARNGGYMGYMFPQLDNCKGMGPGPKYMLPTFIGPDRTRVWKERSLEFTMGARLCDRYETLGPGPAKYLLPDTIGLAMCKNLWPGGRGPQWSLGIMLKDLQCSTSPGPAKYFPTLENKCKILTTMKGPYVNTIVCTSPGPSKYSLVDYKPGKRPPIYSMGARLCGVAPPFIVPADNCCTDF